GRGVVFLIVILILTAGIRIIPANAQGEDTTPPANPVKLIFIHHSCGENWLTDGHGNLGRTLGENNYFTSDTNYGWGPDSIGDNTDIPNWTQWFTGPESGRYLEALYNESGQNSSYMRTIPDPGGENQIVMFKSCFPNSNLEGNPGDPPSDQGWLTVGHAKYVYNDLLTYFSTRPDKLLVVITAPPVQDSAYASNARAFNQWLVNDWLAENDYPHNNVAVWDFHNILTHPDNHHRIQNGAVEYVTNHGDGTLHYDTGGDNHPNPEGNQKATLEYISMLNYFYNRWINEVPEIAPSTETEEQTPVEEDQENPEESQPPQPAPQNVAAGGTIDDFESGAPSGTNGWEAFSDTGSPDTTGSCGVDSSVAQAGTSSLRIDFYVEPESWAACALFYDQTPAFSGTRGLAFDYRSSASAQIFDVNAHGGSPESRSTYYYTIETVPDSVDGWVHLELAWDQIVRVDWEENPGTPVDPVDIRGVAFSFNTYPDTPNLGTIWIDNLTLLGAEGEEAAITESEEETPPQAEETAPTPEEETQLKTESEESAGRRLCPGSMALSLMTVALAGVVFLRKRR
ncbi:MAG: hypothetical protein U9Q82_03070, partial [Chloroflexota bacterium]|nr:hypothetical protein [Chloroflexota bacterium]